MARAEEYGCERDHSEVAESPIVVNISAEEVTHLSVHRAEGHSLVAYQLTVSHKILRGVRLISSPKL